MLKPQTLSSQEDPTAVVDETTAAKRVTVMDDLLFVHCVLLSHVGLAVPDAAASQREWDMQSDPVVRMCRARIAELSRLR